MTFVRCLAMSASLDCCRATRVTSWKMERFDKCDKLWSNRIVLRIYAFCTCAFVLIFIIFLHENYFFAFCHLWHLCFIFITKNRIWCCKVVSLWDQLLEAHRQHPLRQEQSPLTTSSLGGGRGEQKTNAGKWLLGFKMFQALKKTTGMNKSDNKLNTAKQCG